MTTPNIEELIAVLEATNQFHDNAVTTGPQAPSP